MQISRTQSNTVTYKHDVTSRKSGAIKTVLSQFLPALVHFPLRYCYNANNINIHCLLH